jgi:hypothetical protein
VDVGRLGNRARFTGRGATALYIAFRALAVLNGAPGEIIVPDLLCSTALDAVLLAGHTPVFADVTPDRWTLDIADARRKIRPCTQAVLVAHLFGHIANVPHGAFADLGVPIVEDAVQGLGGAVGTIGDITVIGFAPSKMIGGRGGVVLTDDTPLWDAINAISITEPVIQIPTTSERLRGYAPQLTTAAPDLIRPFDDSTVNLAQIESGWANLAENVRTRNEKAGYLRDQLRGTPLLLPEIISGDAIWRYTFAAPTSASANWIARHLQLVGLPGSRLYPSLSAIFAPDQNLHSVALAPRLVNLWVDASVDQAALDGTVRILRQSAPGAKRLVRN